MLVFCLLGSVLYRQAANEMFTSMSSHLFQGCPFNNYFEPYKMQSGLLGGIRSDSVSRTWQDPSSSSDPRLVGACTATRK
jgi:hypothetical protein